MKRFLDNLLKFQIKARFSNFFRAHVSNSNNKVENYFNGPIYFINNQAKRLVAKN
ncbi:MAG: hypothetical protein UR39_C0005G0028 [Candidatus Woesebacteria bacterium GW2011_GWA1_33_30]|uniref:Uncharacterized protein n=1 Tax=Candidatus Woesebacteria bacterium GW2011_GWA2_33_28 TaxID=1618561 RepID=A0A0G0C7K7_9BACT|nr:MAG: hypothetical protein UR38_C0005G0028 [Candidatus Woesebacteria bacterium GW2011_GWA2_33_28]KKP48146.1 MAG: hypothetical protein UR39_C0005G0028 [Candidatus Woesebacteria bacterium GW2011_GWA1_33_30]KKP49388.1 MAG: hypothetical protein UR40_C0006G0028 [Microgenomates group bacterium GW2011_GWC1_33_32]KKP52114.1 MAG: hypothetical protein UR44_C0004G0028 [Candidatus Woesebacteria bacterium GW2011_GWB1_33_38]KKP57589.1 MAG: hypothetical protein UR48_C0014G0018 [Microgenomates group bacteriu